MIHRNPFFYIIIGLALSVSSAAFASDYQQYIQKLNSGQITPLGSVRAGNAEGTIPKWKCSENGVPADIDIHLHHFKDKKIYPAMKPFPFQDEQPRLVITADNYKQYKDKLTPGTIKLLKSYPNEFRVPVYPTHRTACYSQKVYEQTKLNAKHANMVNNGMGVVNAYFGLVFPMANSGLELAWNNKLMPNPFYEELYNVSIAVFPNNREKAVNHQIIMSYYTDPTIGRHKYTSGIAAGGLVIKSGTLNQIIWPPRNRGSANISRSYLLQKKHVRQTWQYLPGTRRVRRYPYFGYDTPTGAGGLRGVDDARIWNGSTDRFNVKYVGTKEMFVPYNAYGWDVPSSYDTVLGNSVVNPSVTRWELHRVDIVVATLKPGARHWYQKRVFYADPDSGHFLMSDSYDHQGELWRTAQQVYVWTPLIPGLLARAAVYYDFKANAYVVQGLVNELPKERLPRIDSKHLAPGFFMPSTLRMRSFR